MSKLRFINGCAKSVVLAQEFDNRGWDAWTCDILPSEGWHKHIQDNLLNHLNDGWDFGIFHPDCTRLANSGVRWYHERPYLQPLVKEAADFFNACLEAPFPHVTENPIQHKYAREFIRKYDQIIQPYWFGDLESKAICLWLAGVPPLMSVYSGTNLNVRHSVFMEPPGVERKANRSRNFPGVSKAMAEQWSKYLMQPVTALSPKGV